MTHDEWLDRAAKDLSHYTGDKWRPEDARLWLAAFLATRPAPGRAEVESLLGAYDAARDALCAGKMDNTLATDAARFDAARTRLLALYAGGNDRACICTYCAYSEPYADTSPDEVRRVRDLMMAHDAVCPRNPLVQRLALYAEPEGEEYEVTDMHNQTGIRTRVIKVPPQEFSASDKVRVVKVNP